MSIPSALIYGTCCILSTLFCSGQSPQAISTKPPVQPQSTTIPLAVAATAKVGAVELKKPANLQQFRPNALPYRIERKTFGASKSFKRIEFDWVVPTTKPKAFIVLAYNQTRPRLPLEDRQWYEFAEKNHLGLISVGFEELSDGGRLTEKAIDLEARLLRITDEVFGPALKGAFFASGRGAYWMHRVVMRKPWMWGFWSSRDVALYPPVSRGIEYPSGLVLNTSPAQYESSLFFFQDLRRAKITNRIGFASFDGNAIDTAYLDRFAQQYLMAILGDGNATNNWFDIHSEANCALLEKPPHPIFQSWVPGDELTGAWKLLNQEQKKLPDSSTAFADVRLLDGKQIKLVYRIPGKVKLGVPVRHVVICLLWAENDEDLLKKVQNSFDYKASLWSRDRTGVIAINAKSFGFVSDMPSSHTTAELKDLKQNMSIYSPDLWKIIGQANAELGWPAAQFHLFGAGIGASIAQAWAYADPSHFLTVHLNGGGPYLDVDPVMSNLCWLLTTGGKNAGYEMTLKFYAEAIKAGWPVLFNSRSGGYGAADDWVWASGAQFCNYTRDLADLIIKDKTDGAPPRAPSASALLATRLKESAFLMELNTRRVLHLEDASLIPVEQRILLPTTEVEEAWRLDGAPQRPTATMSPTSPGPAANGAALPSTIKP